MSVMTETVTGQRWLSMTLFIAFGLRFLLACAVQYEVSKTPGRLCLIAGDAEGYWELAGQIAAGKPYSIFDPPRRLLRMPGFPALLAASRIVFGDHVLPARILLVIVGTVACYLTYWLGRELAGTTAGILGMAYTAVSPTLALFSVLFLSETAFAAAMLGSLIAAARLCRQLSQPDFAVSSAVRTAILTGSLVALATYMRPTWLLAGPALSLLAIFVGRHSIRRATVPAAMVCLSLGLMMAPWTIRNTLITGHVIPTTLWVGPSLYDGLNPDATGDSDMEFFEKDALLQTMSEYEMDREYRRRAWAYAAANPTRVLELALVKQARYWSPAPNSPQFDKPLLRWVGWLAYLPLLGLAMAGVWFCRRNFVLLTLSLSPLFYFAALHLLFVGSLRYRLPAEYPLAVLAACGMVKLCARQPDEVTVSA